MIYYDSPQATVSWNEEHQNWVAQDWYVRSLDAGLKYSAAVIPVKRKAKSSLNRLVSGLEVSNPTEEFDDIDEFLNGAARTIGLRVRKNAKPDMIEGLAYIFVKMLVGPQRKRERIK